MAVSASSGKQDVTDTSTFYAMWEAFVSLKGMCVRYEKQGSISGLGSGGEMSMSVVTYL